MKPDETDGRLRCLLGQLIALLCDRAIDHVAHGVDRALLTCDDDNVGSRAVIEGAGGRLDEAWPLAEPDGDTSARRRYWID